MVERKFAQRNISFMKSVAQSVTIWALGWFMFAGVEIISRKFIWLPLPSSIPLVILAIYSGVGILGGGVVGVLSFLMFKSLGKKVQPITLVRLFMATCITTVVFFYGSVMAYEKFFLHASDSLQIGGIIGCFLFSLMMIFSLSLSVP